MAVDEEEGTSPGRQQFDILREYEVWAGSPSQRKQMAVRLHEDGCTPNRLRMICENVADRGGESAKTARAIAAILQEEWRVFVQDLEYAAARRASRPQNHGRKRREWGPTNIPTEHELAQRSTADEDYVRTRVNDDGRTVEFVADQMNWTEERVREVCGLSGKE